MDVTTPPTSDSDPEGTNFDTPLVEIILSNTSTQNRKPQILASLIVTIGAFALGNVLGWSSPALPNLKKNHEFGVLSKDMESWIGSIVNLGALVSGVVVGYSMDKIGRKLTLLVISVPFVFGWLLIAFSQNYSMILAGRFVTGFCGAAFTLVSPVYIGEIADASIRGALSSAVILVLVTGILFTYVLGSFLTWMWLSIISAGIPVIFVSCMIFMPESPTYLISKGRHPEASQALQWLRGTSRTSQIEADLIRIQESLDISSARRTTWADILSSPIRKPIIICLMLMALQQLGGINAVIFYSVDIFKASGSDINANLASILVGLTQVIVTLFSTFIVDRAGRKILLIISDAGMAIGLIALAIYFNLKEQNHDKPIEGLGWLPVTSLIFYTIMYNIALGAIPWIIMGEILPLQVKGFASSLASSFCWTLSFIVTKNFQVFSNWFGQFGIFLIFGIISAFGSLYVLLIVPETKGKSLDEIQALFR